MSSQAQTCTIFLFTLFLAASGCDSESPIRQSDRGPVGSWTLERLETDTYFTVSSAQEIIDPESEGAGEITLTGGVQATLTYLGRALPTLEPSVPIYAAAGPLTELGFLTPPDDAVRLRVLNNEPAGATVFVGTESRYTTDEESGIAFDAETSTLTLNDVTLSASDGAVVTADGILQAAIRALPVGEATRVGGFVLDVPTSTLTLTFAEDGTFTATSIDESGELEMSAGTWRVEEDELVLEVDNEEVPLPPQRVSYRTSEGRLVLEEAAFDFLRASEEETRAIYEQVYSVKPGTLTTAEQRSTLDFAAVSP